MEEQSVAQTNTPNHGDRNNLISVIVLVIVLGLIGGGGLWKNNKTTEANKSAQEPQVVEVSPTPGIVAGVTTTNSSTQETKTIEITAANFTFSPGEIRVKKGDTVKVVLNNKEGFHDWVVDELNVSTKQVGKGETTEITFIPDKAGTFEFYCSVGSHRQMGMKGNLIVE